MHLNQGLCLFQLTKKGIRKFFGRFGKVQSVTLRAQVNFTNGFVQFESLKSACKALEKHQTEIDGKVVQIRAGDSWHQPDSREEEYQIMNLAYLKEIGMGEMPEGGPMSVDPAAAASSSSQEAKFEVVYKGGLTLDQLNDDCLLEIFSKLDLYDLCVMHTAAERFQPIAEKLFRKKHTSIDWMREPFEGEEFTLHKLRMVLRSCGPFIEKLRVSAAIFNSKQQIRCMDLILRLCTNVKSVDFDSYISEKRLKYRYPKEFFGRLEELTMNETELLWEYAELISECKHLRYLKVGIKNKFDEVSLERCFPKLVNVSLDLEELNVVYVQNFFKKNPQIESLALNEVEDVVIKSVSNHLQALKKLKLTIPYYADVNRIVRPMSRISSLKHLQIMCNEADISKLIRSLSEKNSIEHLLLHDVHAGSRLRSALIAFTNLQTLELRINDGELNDATLLQIGQALTQLSSFKVHNANPLTNSGLTKFINEAHNLTVLGVEECSVTLGDEFIADVAKIYSKRGTKLQLFVMTSDLKVSETMRKKNENFVQIIEVKAKTPIATDSSSEDWNPYYDDFFDEDDDYDMDDSDFEMYDYVNQDFFPHLFV